MKNTTSINQFLMILAGLALLSLAPGCDGLDGDDDYSFCEDEALPWNCDCFEAEEEPIALEQGLSRACEQAKATLEACVDAGAADDNVDYRTADYGREQLGSSDLCNGDGFDDYPSGCMPLEAFLNLMKDMTMGGDCYPDIEPTWYLLITNFNSWKKRSSAY